MHVLLSPTVFRVDLGGIKADDPAAEAEARAWAVIEAIQSAQEQTGEWPTHLIADPRLKINLDILEDQGQLTVLRRPRLNGIRLQVDLARELGT